MSMELVSLVRSLITPDFIRALGAAKKASGSYKELKREHPDVVKTRTAYIESLRKNYPDTRAVVDYIHDLVLQNLVPELSQGEAEDLAIQLVDLVLQVPDALD